MINQPVDLPASTLLTSTYQYLSMLLLLKALTFAEKNTRIMEPDIRITINDRKSILVFDNSFWMTKEGELLFDVFTWNFHEPEIDDLIGLHIFDTIKRHTHPHSSTHYRDEGLVISSHMNDDTMDNFREDLVKNI